MLITSVVLAILHFVQRLGYTDSRIITQLESHRHPVGAIFWCCVFYSITVVVALMCGCPSAVCGTLPF